ncbi:hypothetical protein NDU88_005019 [Pleurodeles waltl]|uniref:Uncharacterized protein n=1 Tax=Pleurodeles waltl TaxID=8319 RepID=A0AAV7M954_PLEWA|nr:hypothetical protein NDU88_005019 [Pleurodeles waltl]
MIIMDAQLKEGVVAKGRSCRQLVEPSSEDPPSQRPNPAPILGFHNLAKKHSRHTCNTGMESGVKSTDTGTRQMFKVGNHGCGMRSGRLTEPVPGLQPGDSLVSAKLSGVAAGAAATSPMAIGRAFCVSVNKAELIICNKGEDAMTALGGTPMRSITGKNAAADHNTAEGGAGGIILTSVNTEAPLQTANDGTNDFAHSKLNTEDMAEHFFSLSDHSEWSDDETEHGHGRRSSRGSKTSGMSSLGSGEGNRWPVLPDAQQTISNTVKKRGTLPRDEGAGAKSASKDHELLWDYSVLPRLEVNEWSNPTQDPTDSVSLEAIYQSIMNHQEETGRAAVRHRLTIGGCKGVPKTCFLTDLGN